MVIEHNLPRSHNPIKPIHRPLKNRNQPIMLAAFCLAAAFPSTPAFAQSPPGYPGPTSPSTPADPGWPREHVLENKKLTVYQPQVDEWKDHSIMHFRCAIEVDGVLKEPTFGVAEIEARTLVESETRTVKLFTTKRDYRFSAFPRPTKNPCSRRWICSALPRGSSPFHSTACSHSSMPTPPPSRSRSM